MNNFKVEPVDLKFEKTIEDDKRVTEKEVFGMKTKTDKRTKKKKKEPKKPKPQPKKPKPQPRKPRSY